MNRILICKLGGNQPGAWKLLGLFALWIIEKGSLIIISFQIVP